MKCNTLYSTFLVTEVQCNTEVISMSISIRVNKKESGLIKKYAELNGKTVSEVI